MYIRESPTTPHENPARIYQPVTQCCEAIQYLLAPVEWCGNETDWPRSNGRAPQETIAVDYQPIYPDFDPLESCVIEQSLYSVLMETRAFYWYFYVTVVMIVVTTAALSLALLFPALIIWTSHGIAAAALWGAFIAAAAMLSGFAFIWFFLAFCHLVYFALTKQRIPDLNLLLIAAVAIITRKKVPAPTAPSMP